MATKVAEVPLHEIPGRVAEIFNALLMKERSREVGSYFCPDVETCSLEAGHGAYNVDKCGVTQVGCAVVTNGHIEAGSPYSIDINWLGHPSAASEAELEEMIQKTKNEIEFKNGIPTGKKYTVSVNRMRIGRPPKEVMTEVYWFLESRLNRGYKIVGYNMLRFDIPAVFNNFIRAGVEVSETQRNALFDQCYDSSWDIGLMIKAAAGRQGPWPNENKLEFYQRVNKMFLTNKWAQDTVGIPAFNVNIDHGIHAKEAHDAAIDCLIPHFIFQKLRTICRV